MSVVYKHNMAALFLVAAALTPLSVFSRSLIASGAFILLFILCQTMVTVHFASKPEHGFHEGYSLWTVIISCVFLLLIIFHGRNILAEAAAILLALGYIISAIVFMLPSAGRENNSEEYMTLESSLSEEELEQFRKKDEMEYLLDSYDIPELPTQTHLTDYPDFKKAKINFAIEEPPKDEPILSFKEETKDRYFDISVLPGFSKDEDEDEGYIELFPNKKNVVKKLIETKTTTEPEVRIIELREAPKIELPKKSIDEKIKLIAEKAIEERQSELKARKEKAKTVKTKSPSKKTKTKKLNNPVYSSITSNIFHADKSCRSMKKTDKKNIILYPSSIEAKKSGLKACRVCKRK